MNYFLNLKINDNNKLKTSNQIIFVRSFGNSSN